MARGSWALARAGAAAMAALLAATLALPARADGLQALRDFAREVRSGRASFTQTVTGPDGVRKKPASGQFEFARPDRFRFAYTKPFEQLVVGDGHKVWIYDADLNQVTVRAAAQALGATPAALLAGGAIEREFTLAGLPDRDGLQWVQAQPKAAEGSIKSLQIGFRGKTLAALEILDVFGQRSVLLFSEVQANAAVNDDSFRFTPPKGADVVQN